MNELIDVLRKIIIKSVVDRRLGTSISPRRIDVEYSEKTIRIPRGVSRELVRAMAKIKDIAKIKIEHRNEKKLREILEERGIKRKGPVDPFSKKGPIIQTNYKIPKKKENDKNESK